MVAALVRLTEDEQKAIVATFKRYFEEGSHLWLFGSRIDPKRKGGDIDLYIETQEQDPQKCLENKIAFLSALQISIGDQKMDIVVKVTSIDKCLPDDEKARPKGIQLL